MSAPLELNAATVALVVILLGASALRRWRRGTVGPGTLLPPSAAESPGTDAPPWREGLVVLALTGGFLLRASALPVADQPLGTDWFAYLKNAIALGDHHPADYQAWRGPLHAWVSLALMPAAGGLLEATQLLALVAQTACLPLTWWIGRGLVGRWPALLAVALLAGWPDLLLFARFSTPYPLLACLFLAGTALTAQAIVATRRPVLWAVPAGVTFGLAVATDLRAGPMAAAVVGGCLLVMLVERRARGLSVGGIVAVLAFVVARGTLAQLPVTMVPLTEQIALQRDLNANSGIPGCVPHGAAVPTLGDLVGECGRSTLATNLARAQRATPVSLVVLALVAAFGLMKQGAPHGAAIRARVASHPPGWGGWFLALPALPALPSLLLVGVQHRYVVPLAPFAALLLTAGLVRWCGDAPFRRWRLPFFPSSPLRFPWLPTAAVVVVLVAWNLWPGTLLRRPSGGTTGVAPAVSLGDIRGPTLLRRALREQARPGDSIVDCSGLGVRLRLYPTRVAEPRTGTCDHLHADGPSQVGTTWLLLPLQEPGPSTPEAQGGISPLWETVVSFPRGRETVALLRAAR